MIATGNRIRHQSREDVATIDRCSFARLVALHCRLSGFEVDDRDLDQWVRACWPMVTEDMRPERWARAYLLAVGLEMESDRG